jgi:hypothetical protein
LSKFFGCDDLQIDQYNYAEMIRAFNEAMNLKDVWTRVVNLVESDKDLSRSTNFASIYGSYLSSKLSIAV